MARNDENVLISTRGVMVKYDAKISDRITFWLPNKQMATLGLVTTEQQIEINKSIRDYTNGKDFIEWSKIGIKNALDIIRAMRKFLQINKGALFYDVITKMAF